LLRVNDDEILPCEESLDENFFSVLILTRAGVVVEYFLQRLIIFYSKHKADKISVKGALTWFDFISFSSGSRFVVKTRRDFRSTN
jgi:hypothetical protein